MPTALNTSREQSPNGVGLEIPINLIPPSPLDDHGKHNGVERKDIQDLNSLQEKDDHDTSKGKKVQRILKERVHKGQAHIHTISRKIGRGSGRHGPRLKRSNSAPGGLSHALFQSDLSHLTKISIPCCPILSHIKRLLYIRVNDSPQHICALNLLSRRLLRQLLKGNLASSLAGLQEKGDF